MLHHLVQLRRCHVREVRRPTRSHTVGGTLRPGLCLHLTSLDVPAVAGHASSLEHGLLTSALVLSWGLRARHSTQEGREGNSQGDGYASDLGGSWSRCSWGQSSRLHAFKRKKEGKMATMFDSRGLGWGPFLKTPLLSFVHLTGGANT